MRFQINGILPFPAHDLHPLANPSILEVRTDSRRTFPIFQPMDAGNGNGRILPPVSIPTLTRLWTRATGQRSDGSDGLRRQLRTVEGRPPKIPARRPTPSALAGSTARKCCAGFCPLHTSASPVSSPRLLARAQSLVRLPAHSPAQRETKNDTKRS